MRTLMTIATAATAATVATVVAVAVTSLAPNKDKSPSVTRGDTEITQRRTAESVRSPRGYKRNTSSSESVAEGGGGVAGKAINIEANILKLNIPNSIERLGLTELEDLEQKITNYFAENEILEAINNDDVEDADKARISSVLRTVSYVRSRAISIRMQGLKEEVKNRQHEIANGELPMPAPLSEYEIAKIEGQTRVEYEKALEQAATRQQREDEALIKERQLFN